MNLLLTFMDLDKLYESPQRLDRATLIKNIKSSGRDYNFEKYSDEQLFRMWERVKKDVDEQAAMQEYRDRLSAERHETCSECGTRLNDGGTCPVCDDGEEYLHEDKLPIGTPFKFTSEAGKYIVRVMWTGSKFIAIADDGIHGSNRVIFTNRFRKYNGELYEVDSLEWDGKNYRAAGNIKSIGNIVDKYQQFNEKINKENLKMNFQTFLEELDHLYETEVTEADNKETLVEADKESFEEVPEETSAGSESVNAESVADNTTEDADDAAEELQLIFECDKCGALTIKAEADVTVDEETGLANVDEECQYCEESAGYTIVGVVAPYEATIEVEEDD